MYDVYKFVGNLVPDKNLKEQIASLRYDPVSISSVYLLDENTPEELQLELLKNDDLEIRDSVLIIEYD